MDIFLASLTSSNPSIGSPKTLNIRPKVSLPTGTVIGEPVSKTSKPLRTPSVGPIATHLTTSSPILNSQVNQVNPVVSTTGVDPTQVNQQVTVSYAPIVSALKPQTAPGQRPKVTVVPIYDE